MVKLSDIYRPDSNSNENGNMKKLEPIREKEPEESAVKQSESFNAEEIYNQAILLFNKKIEDMKNGNDFDINEEDIKTIGALFNQIDKNKKVIYKYFYEETPSNYLIAHSVNVCILSLMVANQIVMNKDQLLKLAMAAFFHDIGMVHNLEEVNSRGVIEHYERAELIEKHPKVGKELILSVNSMDEKLKNSIANIICQHHEKCDGTGYPEGIKENSITNYAKIISVCDIYEALTHSRPWRKSYNCAKAIEMILSFKNKDLSVNTVKLIVDELTIYPVGSLVKLNDGRKALVIETSSEYPTSPRIKIIESTEVGQEEGEVIDLSMNKLFSIQEIVDN